MSITHNTLLDLVIFLFAQKMYQKCIWLGCIKLNKFNSFFLTIY